ncbi:tRNA pseudouridine synthase B [[Mycoplasma] anseris]|uniref:tRNA pseudouridine(55) synthase n=1 Tax=[Mycoplasma] anseris TaxID=92400 RepID=A0A2Z4NDW1_9BACT|nr:tRNA pseudouridine synthase B [[Mycoplasma] anseris]AWX69739.1 tRNA pseudouridine(55) synthase [[Mycoplasma] anseris]
MFYKINKKRGISSFQAIKLFAKKHQIQKIGHAGTLDPLAEGLLIVATDYDTKMLSFIANENKEYFVKATLHKYSASYDEGEEIFELDRPKITKEMLLSAINEIKLTTSQIPPVFSAKKINGIRSYKLARENKEISLKPIKIKINNLELVDFDYENQIFSIVANVSKGTYIRSLIHDIGVKLKTDALVNLLKRTKIGNIFLNQEFENEQITELSSLFNVKLFMLNNPQLLEVYKNRSLFINELSNYNGQIIFMFDNLIIGFGESKFGKIFFSKIFFLRIEDKLPKEGLWPNIKS